MRTVFFDLDDTIYDRRIPFIRAFGEFFDHRYDETLALKGYATCADRGWEVFADSQTGKITMDEMYIHRYKVGLHDIGIEITPDDALQFQKVYKKYQGVLEMTKVMEDILDTAVQRFERVALLTNGPGAHQREKARCLNLERWIPDERIVISGEVGVIKPERGIFEAAQRQLQTQPEETWMIGDAYESDIIGAIRVGWHAVWLNKKNAAVPVGQPMPEHIVYCEEELLELIKDL